MRKVDSVLQEKNLRRIVMYPFTVGDCLFDAISFILGFPDSIELRKNMVNYFVELLTQSNPEAKNCWETYMVLETIRELHHYDDIRSPNDYLSKMMKSAKDGGLWGDHFCIHWLSKFLDRPICIWLATEGKQLETLEPEQEKKAIHLVYHEGGGAFGAAAHYEPVLPIEIHEVRFNSFWEDQWQSQECEGEWLVKEGVKERRLVKEQWSVRSPAVKEEERRLVNCFNDTNQVKEWIEVKPKEQVKHLKKNKMLKRTDRTLLLTNCEVMEYMRATDAQSPSEEKVYQYLSTTPAALQTIECIQNFCQTSVISELSKAEKIQLLNLRPKSEVEAHLILQNPEMSEKILSIVNELPAAEEEEEEEEEGDVEDQTLQEEIPELNS